VTDRLDPLTLAALVEQLETLAAVHDGDDPRSVAVRESAADALSRVRHALSRSTMRTLTSALDYDGPTDAPDTPTPRPALRIVDSDRP
jgi:hypothetical protein